METILDTNLFANLFNQLNNYQLSYAYNGEFTEKLTEQILGLVENSMNVESESSKTKKKVYFIMVESLQNITRHQSNLKDNYLVDGFFSIHKTPVGYLVTSGNIVKNENIEPLKSKLDKLNSLNADELKAYYHELLTLGGFSEKGGAGLGLIEMLRKSGNKLQYDFITISKEYSYFYFQTKVATNVIEEGENTKHENVDLNLAKTLHSTILKNNLKTVFHGQFGHENFKGILAMTENNLSGLENVKTRRAIISVMIELMQNICFHADGAVGYHGEGPGMFMISNLDAGLGLITVNYIQNSKTEKLVNYINEINGLSVEECKKKFLEILMSDTIKSDKGSGLGLLDIRIKTTNKVDISIEPYNEEFSFLVISALVNL
jgi:Family of unknown function (DUF6272)